MQNSSGVISSGTAHHVTLDLLPLSPLYCFVYKVGHICPCLVCRGQQKAMASRKTANIKTHANILNAKVS